MCVCVCIRQVDPGVPRLTYRRLWVKRGTTGCTGIPSIHVQTERWLLWETRLGYPCGQHGQGSQGSFFRFPMRLDIGSVYERKELPCQCPHTQAESLVGPYLLDGSRRSRRQPASPFPPLPSPPLPWSICTEYMHISTYIQQPAEAYASRTQETGSARWLKSRRPCPQSMLLLFACFATNTSYIPTGGIHRSHSAMFRSAVYKYEYVLWDGPACAGRSQKPGRS